MSLNTVSHVPGDHRSLMFSSVRCVNPPSCITTTVDGAWWRGTLSGKVGVFPSSYVQKL